MKVRTSYYYQIRNFTKNMIPVSTTISDPDWYHHFTHNYDTIFRDKRGVINGLRLDPIIECGRAAESCRGRDQCNNKPSPPCPFLASYKNNLNNFIDFEALMKDLQFLADSYQKYYKINNEIYIVLMVYEAPQNPCSERQTLIDYFNEHGVECKELTYPIIKENLYERI